MEIASFIDKRLSRDQWGALLLRSHRRKFKEPCSTWGMIKAPGPEFTVKIFKRAWGIVGPDVVEAARKLLLLRPSFSVDECDYH